MGRTWAASLHEDVKGFGIGQASAVWPVGGQRIEAVDDRKDSGANRNVGASDTIRIPSTVPVLVMVPNNGDYRDTETESQKDVCPSSSVQLHAFKFTSGQFSWLVEDVLRNDELASIVQECSRFKRLELSVVVDAKFPGESKVYLWTRRMWPLVT